MVVQLIPTDKEIYDWMLKTTKHSFTMEYYMKLFSFGKNDEQRPHDLVGRGNKFQWEVLSCFALESRVFKDNPEYNPRVKPLIYEARARHRLQYHHKMWNFNNSHATEEDLLVGALDSVCALREADRLYNGGAKTFDQIREIAKKDPKGEWILRVTDMVEAAESPELDRIESLVKFSNIGIDPVIYDITLGRVGKTMIRLKQDFGYDLFQFV